MSYEAINQRVLTAEQAEEVQRSFVMKVYGWMTSGLFITGIFAMFTISSPAMLEIIFGTRIVFIGLLIAQIGLVIWLSARIQKMTAMTATAIFLGYSALTGITLSSIFLMYTAGSLATTFFITGGTFGAMSLYGSITKRDLTNVGSFMMMGLFGIIIASVVNIFWTNSTLYWITTYIGIFVFVGLTAYDTQKIKQMAVMSLDGSETEQKGAILGALRLYLDFINLFLLLLRVLGRRK